jgi:hypothetical protein
VPARTDDDDDDSGSNRSADRSGIISTAPRRWALEASFYSTQTTVMTKIDSNIRRKAHDAQILQC